jgi:hypothetical protein
MKESNKEMFAAQVGLKSQYQNRKRLLMPSKIMKMKDEK